MFSRRVQRGGTPLQAAEPRRPWWAVAVVLVLATAVSGCGDSGDPEGADGDAGTPTASEETVYDGDWSGTLSTGGVIEFTVSDGTIVAAKVTSGDGAFGPDCGQVSGSNEFPDTEIAIEDGRFSWGGPGEGYPVEGEFDSETTASGTAEFSPPEVMGEPEPGCSAASATWEATTGDAADSAVATTPTGSATEEATGVSAAAAACVADLGYEIVEAGANDLPIADADGEGVPVVDGSPGIAIRGATGAAVFYVYETDAQAVAAFQGSTGNPDIDLVAPRVDAIAIDNVFVLSDAGFVSDDRFYLADCFD